MLFFKFVRTNTKHRKSKKKKDVQNFLQDSIYVYTCALFGRLNM